MGSLGAPWVCFAVLWASGLPVACHVAWPVLTEPVLGSQRLCLSLHTGDTFKSSWIFKDCTKQPGQGVCSVGYFHCPLRGICFLESSCPKTKSPPPPRNPLQGSQSCNFLGVGPDVTNLFISPIPFLESFMWVNSINASFKTSKALNVMVTKAMTHFLKNEAETSQMSLFLVAHQTVSTPYLWYLLRYLILSSVLATAYPRPCSCYSLSLKFPLSLVLAF